MLGLAAAQMVQIIPIVRRPPGGLGSAILAAKAAGFPLRKSYSPETKKSRLRYLQWFLNRGR
jgi:hypothetical protein